MNMIKKLAVAASMACGVVGIGASLVPGVASAAPYNGACGSRYIEIAHGRLKYKGIDMGVGTVYLTYNKSNGYNCVVTIRDKPGALIPMAASVRLSTSNTWHENTGQYTRYVRSPYVYAKGQCIDWGGYVSVYSFYQFHSHCG